jgi:hypothetical protein
MGLTPVRNSSNVPATARTGLATRSETFANGSSALDASRLPAEVAVSTLTLAELAAGPHATADPAERARRQDRLQRARRPSIRFHSMPKRPAPTAGFFAAVVAAGRKARADPPSISSSPQLLSRWSCRSTPGVRTSWTSSSCNGRAVCAGSPARPDRPVEHAQRRVDRLGAPSHSLGLEISQGNEAASRRSRSSR